MKLKALLLAASLLAGSHALTAQAADIQSRLIRFGYGLNQDSNQGPPARAFADQVGRCSGGRRKVRAIGEAARGQAKKMQQPDRKTKGLTPVHKCATLMRLTL